LRAILARRGVVVTATTQLRLSEMRMTVKRLRQNSPVASFEVPMAAKARIATTVAPRSGIAVCPTTSLAASVASCPASMRTLIPSTTTMALSTSMPRAMIRAPREILSRVTPMVPMKRKVPEMVRKRIVPMMSPLRRPMKRRSTTTTMATACPRVTMKPSMAVVTASDCMEILWSSIPRGVWAWSRRSFSLIASPITTTFPPDTVEIPRAMAGSPLKRMMFWGGSTYPRRTVATSFR
jgi:hypothetical protein